MEVTDYPTMNAEMVSTFRAQMKQTQGIHLFSIFQISVNSRVRKLHHTYAFKYLDGFMFCSGSTMAPKMSNGCDMIQSITTTILSETTSGAGNNGLQDKGTLFLHEHVNVIIHSE